MAQAQSLTTAEEVPLDLTLVGLDPNGDPVTYAIFPGGTRQSDRQPALSDLYSAERITLVRIPFFFVAKDGTLEFPQLRRSRSPSPM